MFFHLRCLKSVRRILGREVTLGLVLAFVTARLDYCNSVLAGPSGVNRSTSTSPERRRQTCLALESGHGITSLPFSEACTGFRLSYAYSINCACLCTMENIGRSPAYLADMITATADLPGRERLRSANSFRYETPKLKLKFGERAFSYAGPKAWNSLSSNLQELMNTDTFKKQLKTHLFKLPYE